MNKKKKTEIELWRRIRGDWGAINPVTKVIPNKKKNPRVKHKKKEYDE